MTELTNATILVTGAGGGLGREMVRQFAAAGGRVLAADRTMDLAEGARGDGVENGRFHPLAADLADPAGPDALYEQTRTVVDDVDILVNNAGVALSGPFHAIPRQRWETLLQVNLLAPLRLTHRFLPDMVARRHGHVVNVSSVAGLVGTRYLLPYSSSKFGLRAMGEALAKEVDEHNIRVTNIYPYFTRTPILDADQFGLDEPHRVPENTLYEPEFVVAELLQGIRRNRLHVYPGRTPKLLAFLQRLSPRIVHWLERRSG